MLSLKGAYSSNSFFRERASAAPLLAYKDDALLRSLANSLFLAHNIHPRGAKSLTMREMLTADRNFYLGATSARRAAAVIFLVP
jgi:hypothetical protein